MFDFDGTLLRPSWKPNPALERARSLMREGLPVFVVSASPPDRREKIERVLREELGIEPSGVIVVQTDGEKIETLRELGTKFHVVEFWDDREEVRRRARELGIPIVVDPDVGLGAEG